MFDINAFKQILLLLSGNFRDARYLLAVSGGADSMVLLHLFKTAGYAFEVAHVNYNLRGEDSVKDRQLVEGFCRENEINFHLKEVTETEKAGMTSLQNWARDLRYSFFSEVLKKQKLDFIVTAHHLNDELETFFINLSRGSGIKGLSGIPQQAHGILRPLLKVSKEALYTYAHENRVPYREDLSNEKNDYLRNRIRNLLLPRITEIFPDFLSHFQSSLSHLREVNRFFQQQIDNVFEEVLLEGNDQEFVLDRHALLRKDPALVVEIIRRLGFKGEEIEKIIAAETGKFFRSHDFEIQIRKKEMLCTKRQKR